MKNIPEYLWLQNKIRGWKILARELVDFFFLKNSIDIAISLSLLISVIEAFPH